ncbi:myosin heavy chain-like protein isoform X2 [Tasmannia lanceolata]|uniref:myosin heavy chain-like protein isoform X2 n=1 Tax=Tasmannia lanceolata TaxID=3420 RepID=UPI0040632417
MDSRHASLGRRTLEEIRQKRAAEKVNKVSSGSDLSNLHGMKKSDSANRITEKDFNGLLSRVDDLEKKNAELEDENKKLVLKLEGKEVGNDTLRKRLHDVEENSLPSLQKALRDVQMEKDAAVVAREDLLAQLRSVKKRLKEAEEEQYRAEEDAASLRAEVNSLQEQVMGNPLGGIASIGKSQDQVQAMEKEIADLKSLLQQESLLRQQEQHRLVEEKSRTSNLVGEKEELEARLAALSKKASEEALEEATWKAYSMKDKEKLEKRLHDMAVMVERLESSRQKLLTEIDSQSSEIEKLFEENSNLSASYEDAMGVVVQWENQVKDCLTQNQELRGLLDKLRTEQASVPHLNGRENQMGLGTEIDTKNAFGAQAYSADILSLKGQLAKEQSRAEALSAEVLHLSSELKHAIQAYNNLTRLYKPTLQNIEKNLIKMKQDNFMTVQ